MKRSANEISGHVLKASRGAGLPLGVCEDLAASAPILARNQNLELLCTALENTSDLIQGPAFLDALECNESPDLPDTPWPILQALAILRGKSLAQSGSSAQFGASIPPTPAKAIDVPGEVWAQLDVYAKRTYVPASDASRLAGAGAGLTDND